MRSAYVVGVVAAVIVGCSSLDRSLLAGDDDAAVHPRDDGGGRMGPNGTGGAGPGVGTADASVPVGGDAGADAGIDAGDGPAKPPPGSCVPNPDTEDEVCPEICPEVCNGEDDDCDRRIDEGSVSASCELAHATAVCTDGKCVVGKCGDGWRDCDDKSATGCETRVNTVAHCGACNVDCAELPHTSKTACTAMLACDIATCELGWDDCDGKASNGCETSLTTTSNCGGCAAAGANETCEGLTHVATSSCGPGACAIDQCTVGYGNCDGMVATGCERDEAMDGSCLPAPDCTQVSHGDAVYYFCPGPVSWDEARAACRVQSRGDLVVIDDMAESDFVAMTLSFDSWIGASDATNEGLWSWARGPVPFWLGGSGGSAVLGRFENWGVSEPAAAGSEDCGLARGVDGSWGADDCTTMLGFVCEEIPDRCPADAAKLDPGQCGCGAPDTDMDMDGFAVCDDGCDDDPLKLAEGLCGCGIPDTDTDGDMTPDCDDDCPLDPAIQVGPCGTCFGDALNFDPDAGALAFSQNVVIGCNATFDSTALDFTTWCSGTKPTPVVQTQVGGPDIVIVPMTGLTVSAGYTLKLVGNRPIVLAVAGNATVNGRIDAGAVGATPGAGGDAPGNGTVATAGTVAGADCNVFADGTGQGRENGTSTTNSIGGGGAGFRTNGGFGGGRRQGVLQCLSKLSSPQSIPNSYECKPTCPDNSCDSNGYTGSQLHSNMSASYSAVPSKGLQAPDQSLAPLRSGCAGGKGDGSGTYYGGAGGGGVQLSVGGALTLGAAGIVSAAGGGGNNNANADNGGSGGGSGGAILLEASQFTIPSTAAIRAHGGAGGQRNSTATSQDGHSADDTHATSSTGTGGRGGLSYWDVANATCNGSMASIGSSASCTLPVANWPTGSTAYPQMGLTSDNNGGGGGGGSGGVIRVRRLTLAGVCP